MQTEKRRIQIFPVAVLVPQQRHHDMCDRRAALAFRSSSLYCSYEGCWAMTTIGNIIVWNTTKWAHSTTIVPAPAAKGLDTNSLIASVSPGVVKRTIKAFSLRLFEEMVPSLIAARCCCFFFGPPSSCFCPSRMTTPVVWSENLSSQRLKYSQEWRTSKAVVTC